MIYATNPKQLISVLYPGYAQTSEAPLGLGARFFEKTTPDYDKYNLAKAEALWSAAMIEDEAPG